MEFPPPLSFEGRGLSKTESIWFGVIGDDERIEIAEAARRIFARGVLDVAVGLLPHLKEPVGGWSPV